MEFHVVKTFFSGKEQIDVNYLLLQKYKNPLVICTRSGQPSRIFFTLAKNNMSKDFIKVIGFWDLINEKYISNSFQLEKAKWQKHDGVIFLDPDRCFNKQAYCALIERCKKEL